MGNVSIGALNACKKSFQEGRIYRQRPEFITGVME
jgi:hypothetical protein